MQKSELRAFIVRAEAVAKLIARYCILLNFAHVFQSSPMFGPGRAYAARGAGARTTISSSASVHAVARTTADSAKTMAAETAVAWWP
eukprot:4484445-Prymnesium_polylepis.1